MDTSDKDRPPGSNTFEVGDRVQLKLDSPIMIVNSEPGMFGDETECQLPTGELWRFKTNALRLARDGRASERD